MMTMRREREVTSNHRERQFEVEAAVGITICVGSIAAS
jgi:hypothetical protein